MWCWVGLGWVAVDFSSIVPVFREIRHQYWSQVALSFFLHPHDAVTLERTQLLRALVHVVGIGVEIGIILTSLL